MPSDSRVYKVRDDVEFHETRETGGKRITVSDPIGGSFFRISELQKQILLFFQEKPRRVSDFIDHLEATTDYTLDGESIAQFLENLKSKQILDLHACAHIQAKVLPEITTRAKASIFKLIRKKMPRELSGGDTQNAQRILTDLSNLQPMKAMRRAEKQTFSDPELKENIINEVYETTIIQNRDTRQQDKLNIGLETFSFFNPLPYFEKYHRLIFAALSPITTLAFLIGLAWAIHTLIYSPLMEWRRLQEYGILMMNEYILITIMGYFHTSVHELFHAFICYRLGGKPRKIGFLLFFGFIPAFFADVTDAYRLPRWKRTLVGLGGIIGESVIGILGLIVWHNVPADSYVALICRFNTYLWLGSVYANLIPVFKLDGYYILTDWVGIDNLYYRSFKYIKDVFLSIFLKIKPESVSLYVKSIFIIYVGLTAFLYGFGIILGLNSSLIFWPLIRLIPKIFMFIFLCRIFLGMLTFVYEKIFDRKQTLSDEDEPSADRHIRPLALSTLMGVLLFVSLAKLPLGEHFNSPLQVIRGNDTSVAHIQIEVDETHLRLLEKDTQIHITDQHGEVHRYHVHYALSSGELKTKRRFFRITVFPPSSTFEVELKPVPGEASSSSDFLDAGKVAVHIPADEKRTLFEKYVQPAIVYTFVNWWTVF